VQKGKSKNLRRSRRKWQECRKVSIECYNMSKKTNIKLKKNKIYKEKSLYKKQYPDTHTNNANKYDNLPALHLNSYHTHTYYNHKLYIHNQ
jgi:hypothetical protein